MGAGRQMTAPKRERTLMLLGGHEWQAAAATADRWWLRRAREPSVLVLTSAAQDIPETQVAWAKSHFQELGAQVEGCLIQSPADARNPLHLRQLRRAAAVYLCGGDPGAAREVLARSPAARVLRAIYRQGVPVAGSSAGAMVLSRSCLLPGSGFALDLGVGLARQVVVPHWNSVGPSWRAAASRLARRHLVGGVDEATGLCWDGEGWSVRGPGQVVVISADGPRALAEAALAPPLE